MSSLETSLVTFFCILAGFVLGLGLQYLLPDHHLSKESQDTVKLGAGMVATMSALVLGLLVSSSKGSFDSMNMTIAQDGAKLIQADHLLAEYGPETRALRDQLKNSVMERVQKIWGKSASGTAGMHAVEKSTALTDFEAGLRALTPQTDLQKRLFNQCLQIDAEVSLNRLLIIEQQQESLPTVFLVLLVFWLALLFMSFGLFAPCNITVAGVMVVCALSVTSAVFLILEMSHPLDGFIKVSKAPLLKAMEMIGQ